MHGTLDTFKLNNSKIGGPSGIPSIIEAGTTPVKQSATVYSTTNPAYTAANTLTMEKAGTYRFYTGEGVSDKTTGSTAVCVLYKNGVEVGVEHTTAVNSGSVFSDNLSVDAGDVITVYHKEPNNNVAPGVLNYFLTACINWDNGF
jgi:hypothetical protein